MPTRINLSKLVQFRDTKTAIEANSATLEEISLAYATDTEEIGVFTNGAWVWIGGGAGERAGGHLHGLARWTADGSATTFELPDLAEYVDSVMDNGTEVDVTGYSLSADGSQLVFASVPTSTHIILAHYVLRVVS